MMRHSILAAAAIAVSMVADAPTPLQAEPGDLLELRAEPLTWILEHRSKTGMRVRDVLELRRKAALEASPSRVTQFAKALPVGTLPAWHRKAYRFDQLDADGAGQVIAIPNAFHYPNAAKDLAKFIKTFGLQSMFGLPGKPQCTVAAGPHPCFQRVFARGVKPAFDVGWALESALDIQWVHAIAPGADILYVEASSNSFIDLFQAVQVATNLGATVVTMSWGGPEVPVLHIFEPLLVVPGVTFVAGSGDDGNGSFYPAVSPNVIAAGGTRLPLDRNGDRVGAETAWTGSGGGISQHLPEPSYQANHPIPSTGGFRGFPDIAYNADPETGVAMYLSHTIDGDKGWMTIGGTSAASPQIAALIALANQVRGENLSGHDLLHSPLYDAASRQYGKRFFDIKSGSNGSCGAVCKAAKGYDFVTGFGSPKADALIEALADN
jgi:subtilase family serine protease